MAALACAPQVVGFGVSRCSASLRNAQECGSFLGGSPLLRAPSCTSVPALKSSRRGLSVRSENVKLGLPKERTINKQPTKGGYTAGGRWLNCTTRHVRIYAGYIDAETGAMDQSQLDKMSLILDPDDEFLWPDDKVELVYAKFTSIVDNYAGAPLTEYTLRLIGSDLEHYIRKLLQNGEIQYNMDCRVLNYSMGKPRLDGLIES